MADPEENIVVAKIQNRRGLRRDLPQPLNPGELGLCIDTGQLFIGVDQDDPNSYISLVIETFTPSIQTTIAANQLCQDQVIEVDDPNVEPGDFNAVVVVNSDTRSYLGYYTQADAAANIGAAGGVYFANVAGINPPNLFINGVLALDDTYYNILDAGAVSEVMNFIYGVGTTSTDPLDPPQPGQGLVTLIQNIEVITEASQVASSDLIFPGIEFELVATSSWATIGEPGGFLKYEIASSDSIIIEYSVTDEASYYRTGTLTITTDGTIAQLADNFTDIDNSGSATITFKAIVTTTAIQIQYITSSLGTVTFTTNTRRWKSF